MTEIVSFLLALIPAFYIGWLGRGLVRRIDDPAFPEFRLAAGRRLVFVFIICIAASVAANVSYIAAKVGLAVLTSLAADFPARRRIFGETRGLFAYLSQTLRFWIAMLGALLLLAATPLFVGPIQGAAMPVATLVLTISLLWTHFNALLFPKIIGASPLRDRALESGFDSVIARAHCPSPALHVADAPGGHWVNAFALPSLHRPGVLFTAGLLESLTADETRAIFAHEVAHLEQFNRRRLLLRELGLVVLSLSLLGALVAFGADSAVFGTLVWVWPLVVLAFVAAMMSSSQSREHESDLRALELTDTPEPLIAALTKLHDLLRLPRRWREESEGRMSHPSLARRLRAIRDAAAERGLDVERVDDVSDLVVRDTKDPGQVALLAADRLYWFHGVDAEAGLDAAAVLAAAQEYRSIRYADLTDLRLVVAAPDSYRLLAVDSRGAKLELALGVEDVPRVKAMLETVDLQVRSTSLAESKKMVQLSAGQIKDRLLGALISLLALLPPISLPLTLTGLLVLAKPSRVALLAAGAIGFAAGLLGLRAFPGMTLGGDAALIVLVLEALLGMLAIIRSTARHRAQLPEPGKAWRWTLGLLGGLGALYVVGFAGRLDSPLPIMQTHLWARHEFGFILVLFGLAALLFTARDRRLRIPAAMAVVMAAVLVTLGSTWFASQFSDDPLASRPVVLTTEWIGTERVREVALDGYAVELKLSPSGSRFAVRLADWGDEDYWSSDLGYRVELEDGGFAIVNADDLEFLADDRVATLSYSETGELLLETLHLDGSGAAKYKVTLPPIEHPTLRVDPEASAWEVIGTDIYEGRATRVSGKFESVDYVRSDWNLDASEDAYTSDFVVNGGRQALAVRSHFAIGGLGSLALALGPISGYASTSELLTVYQEEHESLALTSLMVWCAEPAALQDDFVCAANDRESRTVIWSIDPNEKRITPIGSVFGHYYQLTSISGDRLLLGGYGSQPMMLDVTAERAWALELDSEAPAETATDTLSGDLGDLFWDALFGASFSGPSYEVLAMQGNALAVALPAGDSTRVTVYRFPDDRFSSR